jgi:hypothetical protein
MRQYNSRCLGTALWTEATYGKIMQHLLRQEFERKSLSVEVTSSTNNDTLKVVNVVQQIITEPNEAVKRRKTK